MTITILGSQFGDEGKGGIVDVFSEPADIIVRYQGGDNAGHTVVKDDNEYKLSLIPSGVIRGKTGVIGNGCVINPRTLFEEIDSLQERGVVPNVKVAKRAHVILPFHRTLDGIEEASKSDSDKEIGTTGRGIGPTYEDKAARRGIRVADLLDPDTLYDKLEYLVRQKRTYINKVFDTDVEDQLNFDAIYSEYSGYGERLNEANMTVNCGNFLASRLSSGEMIVFEGAQGTHLDIDHGNYPYVTSSNPSAGYAGTGSGLGPSIIGNGDIIGVVKSYLSRVGSGPLPTELSGDIAETIREEGGEYGTVTGRPRRIGWLDMPMLRHTTRVNGLTGIAINHIDVLSGISEIKVCAEYITDNESLQTVPTTARKWEDCEPNYRTFQGWPDVDWEYISKQGYSELPSEAKEYIEYIESELGIPAIAIGVGPERDATIIRSHPLEEG
ncbi:MAG: adenylosuccinate synthase [Halobacteriaceae archaeon]